eukprot:TRINITY_DN250_c1_g1_i1.p1 TRINITY_DN250_c1_g1~~TRINITY_DN250_c1_g1_i1.p1  ORF type:complete len:605 (-),score=60.13 TRINITY_DN250_c1_g1_i1:1522-3315(-)
MNKDQSKNSGQSGAQNRDRTALFVSESNYGKQLRQRLNSQRDTAEGVVLDFVPLTHKLSMSSIEAESDKQQSQEQSILSSPISSTSNILSTVANSISTMSSIGGSGVRIICEYGGQFTTNSQGRLEYQGGEKRLVNVEMLSSLSLLIDTIQQHLQMQCITQGCQLKVFLPGAEDLLVDIKTDIDVQNLWVDLMEYKASVNPIYRLRMFVVPKEESNLEIDDTAYGQSTTLGSGSGSGSKQSQKEVSFSDLEAKLEIIQPEQVSIRRLLGAGAQGEVYLGTWQDSDVAIKCLNMSAWAGSLYMEEGSVDEDAVRELVQEADMLGKLRHPNIVSIYGIVIPCTGEGDHTCQKERENDDAIEIAVSAANAAAAQVMDNNISQFEVRPPAIVEEYMAGGSLFAAIKRRSKFLFGENGSFIRLKLARDTAKGMEYLHGKKIVHFDLKSANILLSKRDDKPTCKVADFSLSKQRRSTYVSNVSSQRGTLPWIAPEIIRNPAEVNEKADVYSFAIVMWELWTGKEPYAGMNYHTLYHKLSSNADCRPPLPGDEEWEGDLMQEPVAGYKKLMEECWTTVPADRPTFKDIILRLEQLLLQNIPEPS